MDDIYIIGGMGLFAFLMSAALKCQSMRSDCLRQMIDQLWNRNAEDRKLIGELRERVEELEESIDELMDLHETVLAEETT